MTLPPTTGREPDARSDRGSAFDLSLFIALAPAAGFAGVMLCGPLAVILALCLGFAVLGLFMLPFVACGLLGWAGMLRLWWGLLRPKAVSFWLVIGTMLAIPLALMCIPMHLGARLDLARHGFPAHRIDVTLVCTLIACAALLARQFLPPARAWRQKPLAGFAMHGAPPSHRLRGRAVARAGVVDHGVSAAI